MKLKYDDRSHAYWLDGKRCKSVTTLAKIPDDTYALDQWRKRQVVAGMAVTPTLVERAAAHYDDRDQLERIAEEAMAAAKSHDAADRGTAAHRIAERHDLEQMIVDTPFSPSPPPPNSQHPNSHGYDATSSSKKLQNCSPPSPPVISPTSQKKPPTSSTSPSAYASPTASHSTTSSVRYMR